MKKRKFWIVFTKDNGSLYEANCHCTLKKNYLFGFEAFCLARISKALIYFPTKVCQNKKYSSIDISERKWKIVPICVFWGFSIVKGWVEKVRKILNCNSFIWILFTTVQADIRPKWRLSQSHYIIILWRVTGRFVLIIPDETFHNFASLKSVARQSWTK